MAYQMSREPVMSRDDSEVQFVIDWLGPAAAEAELLDSYRPPANWAGDYEKIFALGLSEEAVAAALAQPGMVRGDAVTPRIEQAIDFALFFTEKLPWFPPGDQIRSAECHIALVKMVGQGEYTDAADLLILHPARRRAYFVAAKM